MHTIYALIAATLCFIALGAISYGWCTAHYGSSPLWAVPVAAFLFCPAIVAGAWLWHIVTNGG